VSDRGDGCEIFIERVVFRGGAEGGKGLAFHDLFDVKVSVRFFNFIWEKLVKDCLQVRF